MEADDLFPPDDQGDDHPIMKLFDAPDNGDGLIDMIMRAMQQPRVVDTSDNLSGFNTKEKGRTT